MTWPHWIPLAAVAAVTGVAAATDLWKFRVYNALNFPALLGGLLVSCWLGGLAGLGGSLLGAVVGFAVLAPFFALGGVGAGDVKLLTAIGAWLGPGLTAEVALATALSAGLYAVVVVACRRGLNGAYVELSLLGTWMLSPRSWHKPMTHIHEETGRADRRRRLVPYAAMTCLGFFVTLAWRPTPLAEGRLPAGGALRASAPSIAGFGGVR